MRLRSLLFVPGDRPERMSKALLSGADALILDLEDSVLVEAKSAARQHVRTFLRTGGHSLPLFVRVNPLDGPFAEADLAAVLDAGPSGIVLPKSEGGASIAALDAKLAGWRDIKILPISTETPQAIFGLGTYRGASDRLCGITWGAEDLLAAVGASTAREADGRFTEPLTLARSLALFGAAAAGVPAIETVFPAFRDLDGLATYAARGRRDGFAGMLAIHPAQVPVINAAFTPTEDEIRRARAIVMLFEKNEGVGVLQLEGRMVDAPHLKQAQNLLAKVQSLAP